MTDILAYGHIVPSSTTIFQMALAIYGFQLCFQSKTDNPKSYLYSLCVRNKCTLV